MFKFLAAFCAVLCLAAILPARAAEQPCVCGTSCACASGSCPGTCPVSASSANPIPTQAQWVQVYDGRQWTYVRLGVRHESDIGTRIVATRRLLFWRR